MARPQQALPSPATAHAGEWVAVVDDDASIRGSLARVFRCHGIVVETFGSAEQYLHGAVGHESSDARPRCLVLDVNLGRGLSGFELHDRLVLAGIAPPVVFITGHDDVFSARRAASVGCGFLRKPIDMDALLSHVRAHLPRERRAGGRRGR